MSSLSFNDICVNLDMNKKFTYVNIKYKFSKRFGGTSRTTYT